MSNETVSNLFMLAMLPSAERDEDEKKRREAEDRAFEKYCYRRVERFRSWAMKQSKEDIAEHLAHAVLLLTERAKTDRVTRNIKDLQEQHVQALQAREKAALDVAREYISLAHRTRQERVKGARQKLANDDKQKAKAKALALWCDWKDGKHPELRTVEQFAVEVVTRWPVLTSVKVVCGWSSNWTKAVRRGETPAC